MTKTKLYFVKISVSLPNEEKKGNETARASKLQCVSGTVMEYPSAAMLLHFGLHYFVILM